MACGCPPRGGGRRRRPVSVLGSLRGCANKCRGAASLPAGRSSDVSAPERLPPILAHFPRTPPNNCWWERQSRTLAPRASHSRVHVRVPDAGPVDRRISGRVFRTGGIHADMGGEARNEGGSQSAIVRAERRAKSGAEIGETWAELDCQIVLQTVGPEGVLHSTASAALRALARVGLSPRRASRVAHPLPFRLFCLARPRRRASLRFARAPTLRGRVCGVCSAARVGSV